MGIPWRKWDYKNSSRLPMTYEFKNIRVVIVESSREMSELTKSVLMQFGVNDVITAQGSVDGFNAFCKHQPDLVIIDWLQEPDSGLDLTKRIRTDDRSPNRFVPIILMTGFTQKKRVIMARDSGITEFVVKPFTAKALYQKIEHIIEMPRAFVNSTRYFGPDRRRKRDESYEGGERREERKPAVALPSDKLKMQPSAVEKALEIQKRHNDKSSDKKS